MPSVGVQQRFGKAGWLAQRWAQGRDDRPVRPTVKAMPEPIVVALDPPAATLSFVLASAMAVLHPHLQALQDCMEGYRHLRLQAHFLDGSDRAIDIAFVEPVSQAGSLQPALEAHLRKLNWPQEMVRLSICVLEAGELRAQQLSLFPLGESRRTSLAGLAQQLVTRFGPIFLRVEFTDPNHAIAARRFRLTPLV
jgi:hypothetical protein